MNAIDTFTLAEPTSVQAEKDQHQHHSLRQCVEHALQVYFDDLDGQETNDLYQLVRLYRYQFGMRSKRALKAFDEHCNIVEAIKRRDGEMAEHMMRAHIRASRENVERLLVDQAATVA